jgi:hypothetical protein
MVREDVGVKNPEIVVVGFYWVVQNMARITGGLDGSCAKSQVGRERQT